MFEPMTDQDLARLHAKFVVPIIVDQMLRDEEPLDDIAEHAMNEILMDFCPDTALLCLAMCARHIARETSALPISRALANEAAQIIDEYGPLWLAHERNPENIDEAAIKAALVFIPEDFEALRDLFEATMGALEEDHCIAAILCDILSLQADYHRDMAEIELQALSLRPQSRGDSAEVAFAINAIAGAESDLSTARQSENVIPFPAGRRKERQSARS